MSADLTEWNSNATLPHTAAPYERAVSSEEALCACLAEIQRLHNIIAKLSAEAAESRAKLANARATLSALAAI